MLPIPAAQENLARFLRSKLSGEARKCIFGSTYNNIEELIEKLKRVYAPAKSVYQLQGELGNTYVWKKEIVLSYAARITEIADSIEDAHRLTNNGQVDNTFKRNLQRDVIQCFIRGLRPELEIRVKTKETFKFVDFYVTGIINKIILLLILLIFQTERFSNSLNIVNIISIINKINYLA